MVETAPDADPARINALLDAGDLAAAREALSRAKDGDERFAVVRIRLGLYDGSVSPGSAMQQLIHLMRRDENLPGAKELYQEASRAAFQSRQSSVSHSHPPPPVDRSKS